jgi:hypothetical protein
MTPVVRAVDHDSPLTDELQQRLLEALSSGLTPRFVALLCGCAPKTLYAWLDAGAKRDAMQPYRAFATAWVRTEAALMQTLVERWHSGLMGSKEAQTFLERRWPTVWGKDSKVDYELFQQTASNAEDLAELELILADPASYGMLEVFARHDRLTPEERLALDPSPKPAG